MRAESITSRDTLSKLENIIYKFQEPPTVKKMVFTVFKDGKINRSKEYILPDDEDDDYKYDDVILFYLIIDTTGSMRKVITSAQNAIRVLTKIAAVLAKQIKIILIDYRDYDIESGYPLHITMDVSDDTLYQAVENLSPYGGGDDPEAVKTALGAVETLTRKIPHDYAFAFLFTDAPPHANDDPVYTNTLWKKEQQMIPNKYHDWINILKMFSNMNIRTFSFLNYNYFPMVSWYALLAEYTNATCFMVKNFNVDLLTKGIVYLFSTLLGDTDIEKPAKLQQIKFVNQPEMEDIHNEKDASKKGYLLRDIIFREEWCQKFDVSSNIDFISPLGVKKVNISVNNSNIKLFLTMFKELIITNIEYITIVPSLARLWRQLCKFAKKHAEVKKLIDLFSRTVSNLQGKKKELLAKFLEDSYDAGSEIDDYISKFTSSSSSNNNNNDNVDPNDEYSFYIPPENRAKIMHTIFLSLFRDFSSANFSAIFDLVKNIELIKTGNIPKDDDKYVPACVGSGIFSVIARLLNISKEVILTKVPTFIMALIAYYTSNDAVSSLAKTLLEKGKGKWLNFAEGCYWSPFFLTFVSQRIQFFTKEEIKIITMLVVLTAIRSNLNCTIVGNTNVFTQGFQPAHTVKCDTCGHHRPVSLMVTPTFCGLCHYASDKVPAKDRESACPPVCTETHAFLVQCSKCSGIYGVDDARFLSRDTYTCHYCRNGLNSSLCKIACTECGLGHIIPATEFRKDPEFTCFSHNYVDINIKLGKFILENISNFSDKLRIPEDVLRLVIESNQSLYKLLSDKFNDLNNVNKLTDDENYVWKFSGILVQIKTENFWDIFGGDTIIIDYCSICYVRFNDDSLITLCDKQCGKICHSCSKEWLKEAVQLGKIIKPNRFGCMYCTRPIPTKLFKKFNSALLEFVRKGYKKDLEKYTKEYWGLCKTCSVPKFFAEHECAGDLDHDSIDFECDDCKHNGVDPEAVNCPSCKIPIYKSGGCNHITCTECDTHFCYVCAQGGLGEGSIYDSNKIYDHLSEVHNGYW